MILFLKCPEQVSNSSVVALAVLALEPRVAALLERARGQIEALATLGRAAHVGAGVGAEGTSCSTRPCRARCAHGGAQLRSRRPLGWSGTRQRLPQR